MGPLPTLPHPAWQPESPAVIDSSLFSPEGGGLNEPLAAHTATSSLPCRPAQPSLSSTTTHYRAVDIAGGWDTLPGFKSISRTGDFFPGWLLHMPPLGLGVSWGCEERELQGNLPNFIMSQSSSCSSLCAAFSSLLCQTLSSRLFRDAFFRSDFFLGAACALGCRLSALFLLRKSMCWASSSTRWM